MGRVIASSIVGNALEWFDFLIYANMGSVISKLFFPDTSQYARLLSFYGIFAAGFLVRPLGAAFFGWIGDKFGRKTALTWSIWLMSIPTALVGCLPTYDMAGMAAPVLLVLCRVLQGFAVGGEFSSTMVFLVEHAPPAQQGLHGSWAFLSVMVGVLIGSSVSIAFHWGLTDDQLFTWGWRVPFIMSLLGAGVGVWIRRRLKEPPGLDAASHAGGKLSKMLTALATVIMIDFIDAVGFYLTVIYMPLYFQEHLGLSRQLALSIHTFNMVVFMAVIPLGGWLSDQLGRWQVMLGFAVGLTTLGYPIWLLLQTRNPFIVLLSQAAACCMVGGFSGPLPATMAALFPPQLRCRGISIGHNLSMAVFGGTAPLVATAILQGTGDEASPGILLATGGALSAIGVLMAVKLFRVP